MGDVSSASSPADADDPDLAALEDLLGPRKGRRPSGGGAGEPAPGEAGEPADEARDAEDGGDAGKAAAGTPPDPADEAADAGAAPAPQAAPEHLDEAQWTRWQRSRTDVVEAERLPAITTLSPMEPAMGLADTLRRDRFVTVPVRPWPRLAGVAVAGLAGLLWVLALRSAGLGSPWPRLGLPATWWLFLLALAGVGGYFVAARTWPERELRLPMAPSQEEQFQRMEAHVELLRRAMLAGLAGAAAGLLLLGVAFRFFPAPFLLGLGSLLFAGGAVLAIAAGARWRPTRLLYVQTLVLQRLEGMGLGRELALDPRTADVLLALDRLLGQLPESSLRQFLSRPEAQWYLELIQKVKGGRGAR